MLKNIPSILSPELLKILMEMGHGDELCIGDGNFPAANYGRRLVRLDGHGVPHILDAVMQLFPLDTFVEKPVYVMEVVDKTQSAPPIWKEYAEIIRRYEPSWTDFQQIERFAFYEQATRAYAIVATGEGALYANLILKKGVIT
ncbi:MAG: fucose isomerase [Spirochaetes bacterium]|jgi:L-fucose mutarotase|nr:fucose isomerase [Spirochaetota bacterium]